ncbi:Nuclear factor related to kappa-B-binding protein, partial [Stegodyphus mimosarum]
MDSDIHSDSSSSLDESGDSADENDLGEACSFKRRVLQLPECFCAEEDVFREVLNPATWKSVLNSKHGERLKSLLPVFPDDDEKEKSDTLRKLVEGENFKFGSPFKHFFHKLKDGFLSSDVVKVTNALKRANYREYRNQQQQYSYHLLQDILVSRKKLIDASYTLPPDQAVKMQQFTAKPKDATLSERTRLRYFSALQDLRDETGELETSSEDENYPESSPPKVPRKYKKQMQLHEASLSFEMTRITPTTSFPQGYPGSGHFLNHSIDMFEVSEERYREMLLTHKERMFLDPNHPELVISHIKLKDVTIRSNMTKRPSSKMSENPLKKKLKVSENSEKSVNSAYIHDYEGDSSASFATIFNREDSSFSTSGHDTNFDVMPPSVQETEVQTDPLMILDEGEDSQMFDPAHQT